MITTCPLFSGTIWTVSTPASNGRPPRRKLSLREWAQLGEVIGMVAVVVSLLLVVYSINQNTVALRGTTDNLLFELHTETQAMTIEDVSLAEIIVRLEQPDAELTPVETVRWTRYRHNLLDLWALAYSRYSEGLMPEVAWQAWNTYFIHRFSHQAERLSREEWEEWHWGWSPEFWDFVGQSLGFIESDAN